MERRILAATYRIYANVGVRPESDLKLPFDGERLPILRFEAVFAPNEVPAASMVLATGQEIGTDEIAPTVEFLANAGRDLTITVILSARGDIDESRSWPEEDIEIWHGYCDSVTMSAANGGRSFSVSSSHWLSALSEGSSASADVSPSSFSQLALDPRDISSLYSSSGIPGNFQEDGSDIWKDFMLPVFERFLVPREGEIGSAAVATIASLKKLGAVNQDQVDWLNQLEIGNKRAYEILSGEAERGFNQSQGIVPASLVLRDISTVSVGVWKNVENSIASNRTTQTVWQKLVHLAQHLRFLVVPTVGSATLAPYSPVFAAADARVEIGPGNITLVGGSKQDTRRCAGVGLFGAERSNLKTVKVGQTLIGAWIAPGANGSLHFESAPPWLVFSVDPREQARQLHGTRDDTDTILERATVRHETLLRCGSRYARSVWQDLSFRGRTANLNMPFRLDISPGTLVRLTGLNFVGEDATGTLLGTDKAMYGYVSRVRLLLDSEQSTPTTQVVLSHLRSEREESLLTAGGGDTGHPIYNEAWNGSFLVNHD